MGRCDDSHSLLSLQNIGEATIRAIVERGGKVIIFDINEERGEVIASELSGSVFWPGATDVAGEDSVISSIEKGVAKFGTISGVVNCGGIGMAQKVRKESENVPHTLHHLADGSEKGPRYDSVGRPTKNG